MLQQLRIQNYVLIEDLEMNVSGGLTIITGETGAGKTILLGAMSLILGQRADTAVLRDKQKKCIIEGQFEIKNYRLEHFFKKYELDYELITSLRREISADGKSRAFINDTPVNLNQLKELGSMLVDIHSQHETLTLQNSGFQLNVVDAYCRHEKLLSGYREEYKDFKKNSSLLDNLVASESKSKADLDYFQFQFNELEISRLVPGEQERMQQELETLTNAEEIRSRLGQATGNLQEGERNIISLLEEINTGLRSVARYNPQVEALAERIKSTLIDLKDISGELDHLSQQIVYDNDRIKEINERLDVIFHLQQKHRVNTIEELLHVQEDLSQKLLRINSLEDEIKQLKDKIKIQEDNLQGLARQLSENRNEAALKIEKEIKGMLGDVGMPHGILRVEMQKTVQLGEDGTDRIRFMFSANKGVPLQELGKVASGGEMSRLMLCIKSMMARLVTLPTIIFDEIDSGISGEIAFKVGSIIEKISTRHQVMAITHLPQMASRGDAHLLVYKKTSGKTTHTGIRILNQQERINEIAKMLSGNELTEAALENAKELLAK
jgi:DNA repair protein RecN (Recombination protein N)